MTEPGAWSEADLMLEKGFEEGPPNTHPGQGTACRRFFFANAMLEFLWVEDEAEARSARVHPLRLWERWSGRRTGACPFGIAFRPARPEAEPPWPTFDYFPSFFPAPAKVNARAPIVELPLMFILPPFERPPTEGPTLTRYHIEGPPKFLMEIEFADAAPLRFEL